MYFKTEIINKVKGFLTDMFRHTYVDEVNKMKKVLRYFIVGFTLILFTTQVIASKGEDKDDDKHISIVSVESNIETGSLVVKGLNLLYKEKDDDDDDDDKKEHHKKVTLGDYEIVVETWTNTMIVAYLPPGLIAGDYRLTVITKEGESHQDSYDLTVGAVGPKGDTGAQGPQGLMGMKGDKGDKGDTGAKGPQGLMGLKGNTGFQGPQGPMGIKGDKGMQGPRGPQGIPGIIGLANQKCPTGDEVIGFDASGNIICNTVAPIRCTNRVFTFTLNSSNGSTFTGANWPGSNRTGRGSLTPDCSVTVKSPSGNVSLVGTLGDRWRVTSRTGYSSCFGIGGEDGDGVSTPNCSGLTLSIGSVASGRPSCSNSLCSFCTGRATTAYRVQCLQ